MVNIWCWEFWFLMHDDFDSSWSCARHKAPTCVAWEESPSPSSVIVTVLWPMTHDVQGPPHAVSAGNVRLICWARYETESVARFVTEISGRLCSPPWRRCRICFPCSRRFPRAGHWGPQRASTGGSVRSGEVRSVEETCLFRCFFFSNSYIFPCAFTRGSNYYVRPSQVRWVIFEWWPSSLSDLSHVGPADIDVVAALGDHTVSGTAALANSTSDTFKDFPEVSFAMGLWKWWRRSY